MALGDILLTANLNITEACSAIASLFGIDPNDVLVVSDLEDLLAEEFTQHRILCLLSHIPSGDFRTLLSFHEGNYSSLPRTEIIKRFCTFLNCECLSSDDGVNPYRMLLTNANGDTYPIFLDAERLDNNNEYVVLR